MTTTTTATSCPAWCSIEHDRIETEGGHEAILAKYQRGDVGFYRQPCGDHEVQLWLDGNDSLTLPASDAPMVLRQMARALTEAARRLDELNWRRA